MGEPITIHTFPYNIKLDYLIYIAWKDIAHFRSSVGKGLSLGGLASTREYLYPDSESQLRELRKSILALKKKATFAHVDPILGIHAFNWDQRYSYQYHTKLKEYYAIEAAIQVSDDSLKDWAAIGKYLAEKEFSSRGQGEKATKFLGEFAIPRAYYIDSVKRLIDEIKNCAEEAIERNSFPHITHHFQYEIEFRVLDDAEWIVQNLIMPTDNDMLEAIVSVLNSKNAKYYEVFECINELTKYNDSSAVKSSIIQSISNGRSQSV